MRSVALFLAICAIVLSQANEYNAIYRGEIGAVFSAKPNAFLVEMALARRPGNALDAGMRHWRNSIYLAQQGWAVTEFDPADEGVRRARIEASRLGLTITPS